MSRWWESSNRFQPLVDDTSFMVVGCMPTMAGSPTTLCCCWLYVQVGDPQGAAGTRSITIIWSPWFRSKSSRVVICLAAKGCPEIMIYYLPTYLLISLRELSWELAASHEPGSAVTRLRKGSVIHQLPSHPADGSTINQWITMVADQQLHQDCHLA